MGRERKKQQAAYAAQRTELDAVHASCGVNVFVSPFDILKQPNGIEISYCTWPEGVASWLPRTDAIAFTGTDGDRRWFLIVPWEDVERTCSDVLAAEDVKGPPRFRTLRELTAAELSKLRSFALLQR